MKLSFVVSMDDWIWALGYMSEMGFDGIELAVKEPEKVNTKELGQYLKRCSLELSAIGTGQAYLDQGLSLIDENEEIRIKTVNLIKRHIELAADYGAKIIIGLIRGKLAGWTNRQKAYEFFKENMLRLNRYAKTRGVDLMIEPLNRYETDYLNSIEEVITFINTCDLKQTGVLLDTFHMNIEESDWDSSIKKAMGNLKHIHIADSNRCCPGRGHVNFSDIIKKLKAIGYEGFYSGEIQPVPDLKTAIRQYYSYMRKLDE